MNCGIRTQKNNKIVHMYVGLNNYIVKAYVVENGKPTRLESVIVNTWFEALDKHVEFCKNYLLPTHVPAKEIK